MTGEPDGVGTPGLDEARLRATIHALRWCKWSDTLHAIAHDDDDEDGYRAAFIREYAAPSQASDDRTTGTDDASEYGRLLAERDRLIGDGVDPADLELPLDPTP